MLARSGGFVRTGRAGSRRGRRRLVLTLLAAVLWEQAPAAGQAGGSAAAKPDQAAVDRAILNGYRRYNATCSHCHGSDGLGSTFAPSASAPARHGAAGSDRRPQARHPGGVRRPGWGRRAQRPLEDHDLDRRAAPRWAERALADVGYVPSNRETLWSRGAQPPM
jgi:mono/diheme cytochrome c family protein